MLKKNYLYIDAEKNKAKKIQLMSWFRLQTRAIASYRENHPEKKQRADKSTLLSPKFQEWFINVTEGYPPPFVLVSDKKFHVDALRSGSVTFC